MVGTATEEDILSIPPRSSFHVHLGGSVSEATAIELARRHGLDPEAVLPLQDGRYPSSYPDLPHFLRTFMAINDLVRTRDDVETVAAAFARGRQPRVSSSRGSPRPGPPRSARA